LFGPLCGEPCVDANARVHGALTFTYQLHLIPDTPIYEN